MNDERIDAKLSIIKKRITILWTIIAMLSIAFKWLLIGHFPNFSEAGAEFGVFIFSFIAIINHLIVGFSYETPDERMEKSIHNLYKSFFILTIVIALASYLWQIVHSQNNLITGLPINLYINLFFSLTFLFYYIYARRQGIYFNYRIIEKTTKAFIKSVFLNIISILSVGVLSALLVISLDALQYIPHQEIATIVIIFLSCFIIVFEYLFLSIYERNHATEALNHENGKTVLISRNAFLLTVMIGLFNLVFTVFNSHYYASLIDYQDLSGLTINVMHSIHLLLIYANFDFSFLKILFIIIVFLSLKRSHPEDKKILKMISFLQLFFVFLFFIQLFYMTFIHPLLFLRLSQQSTDAIQPLLQMVTIVSFVIVILSFSVPLVLFFYFSKRKYSFAPLFLVQIGLSIISIVVPVFINRTLHINLYMIFIYVSSILYFSFTIILWNRVTKTYRYIMNEPELIIIK